MKISFIIPSLQLGGAEIQTINTCNLLYKSDVPVQLIVLSDSVEKKTLSLLDKNISIQSLNNTSLSTLSKQSILATLKYRKTLANAINSFSPTHIFSALPLSHFMSRFVYPLLHSKPKLWIYHHGTEFTENPLRGFFSRLFFKINQTLAKKYDYGHVHISEAVKDDITRNSYTVRDKIVYNCVSNQVKINENLVSKFNLIDKKYWIIPGRLQKVKGHLFFLRSAGNILIENNITLVIAGGGPEKNVIEAFIDKNGLKNNIILTGQIENDEILGLIKNSSLCIIPSLVEGLGIVAIEALMLGTQCLTSDAGGLKEVISPGQNGYIFTANDEESLIKELKKQINTEVKHEISPSFIIKSYESKFSPETHIQLIKNIIEL